MVEARRDNRGVMRYYERDSRGRLRQVPNPNKPPQRASVPTVKRASNRRKVVRRGTVPDRYEEMIPLLAPSPSPFVPRGIPALPRGRMPVFPVKSGNGLRECDMKVKKLQNEMERMEINCARFSGLDLEERSKLEHQMEEINAQLQRALGDVHEVNTKLEKVCQKARQEYEKGPLKFDEDFPFCPVSRS